MNLFALTWLDGFVAGLFAVAAFVLAVVNHRRITRLDERAEARFRAVETQQLQAPTRDDFNRIDTGLREMATAFAGATVQLNNVSAGVSLLTEYLVRKGAEHAHLEERKNADG